MSYELVEQFILYQLSDAVFFLAIILIAWILWCLFYRPYNLVKDYSDFGYDHIDKSKGTKKKRDLVNLLLKRRKAGDLPPPFPNSWYSVLESDQLANKQVKEVNAVGHNLVVWRGEDSGQAFVADAYCPHLGAHLGVGGTVMGNFIKCPFHSWSFDGSQNGAVVDVPYTKQDITTSKLPGLKLWRVMECNGFIWIWYHNQNMDPTWFPEEIIKNDGISKWQYHGRSEFQVNCHIQEIAENGADVSHLQALHENPAVSTDASSKLTKILGVFFKHSWIAHWTASDDPENKHEAVLEMLHSLALFGGNFKFCKLHIIARQIGAGIVVLNIETPVGNGVLIHSVTPIEPLLHRITQRLYSQKRIFHPFALLILIGEASQIARDVKNWNRKCYLSRPNLVKEDTQIKTFRRWFSQFYTSGSGETASLETNYFIGNGNKFEF